MKWNAKDKSPEDVRKMLTDAWLNIYVNEDTMFNPLMNIPKEYEENPHLYYLYLMSRPEYFSFFCREILDINMFPFQAIIQSELWNRKFPMLIASRGASKTWSLALYALLRAVFIPGRKIVIAGAGFRQSKLVFDYIINFWNNSPLLRDFLGNQTSNGYKMATDTCKFTLCDSTIIALPIGTGDKIRGIRSHDLLADEFSSHSEEIFETVLSGFGNVASNPTLAAQKEMAKRLAKKLNFEFINDDKTQEVVGNQIVFSGTAYYHFNHFYRYWKRWKTIIESEGDPKKLSEFFPDGVPKGFDHTHYSVIRLPIEVLPPGFMDEGQIARAKATMNSSIYSMEMGAVFSEDSNGFFKASLINSCVCDHKNSISKEGYENIVFKPKLYGDSNKNYIIAVDPASENDNFAITVLELYENHRRVVHCWTTNSKDFKEKRKNGEVSETDFYGFCARKIRQLMQAFPCSNIAIDSQGGGKAVYEALHDKDKLNPGDQMIWEIIEPGVDKDCDGEEGLHIVHLINFAKADFTSGANHGMKKDFEDKVLLFPEYDPSFLALYAETGDSFGSPEALAMEDCIYEIEDLKKELTQIVITLTASGRERWDTPEVKTSNVEKGKLRKDRYSALLMANWVARNLTEQKPLEFNYGGFSRTGKVNDEPKFTGPSWLTKQLNSLY